MRGVVLRSRARLAVAAMVGALASGTAARGQGSDAALRDRVAQLVERLEADDEAAREAAEKGLVKLGAKVLPLLPEPAKLKTAAARDRLDRVRAALAEATSQVDPGPTRVTIQGKGIRLTEAIQQLQAQTGNPISDVREEYNVEVTNPALDLDLEDKTFFEALDEIAAQAGISTTAFTDNGSIGLMGGPTVIGGSPPVVRTGPFKLQLQQIAVLRDFADGARTANVQLQVGWEPRLRPMLLEVDAQSLDVVDDKGREVEPSNMEMETDLEVRPENPGAEINLELTAPERDAKSLAKLRFKAELTVPAGLRTFRFPEITKAGQVVKQGDVAVTLESFEVDEQVWKVQIIVAYPEGGPAFESYRQGVVSNRLWLQRQDGSRFEHNGGFSQNAAGDGRVAYEYLFVDAPGEPGDYHFVLEAPSRVVKIPLEAEFKDVPLP